MPKQFLQIKIFTAVTPKIIENKINKFLLEIGDTSPRISEVHPFVDKNISFYYATVTYIVTQK